MEIDSKQQQASQPPAKWSDSIFKSGAAERPVSNLQIYGWGRGVARGYFLRICRFKGGGGGAAQGDLEDLKLESRSGAWRFCNLNCEAAVRGDFAN